MGRKARQPARKGTGSVVARDGRFMAQVDLGVRSDGSRQRRSKTFDNREEAEEWLLDKWGGLVRLKSRSARRAVPLRPEVIKVLQDWRARRDVWAGRLGEEWGNEHDLVFTTPARHRRSSATPT